MSSKKTRGSAPKTSGIRTAGVRSEKTENAYAAATAKVVESWGVTKFNDIFPPSLCPEQELGYSAITNLKSISQYEKDLGKVQLLMFEHCVDKTGAVTKIGFKHTDSILKALKVARASDAGKACSKPSISAKVFGPAAKEKILPKKTETKGKSESETLSNIEQASSSKRGIERDVDYSGQIAKKSRVTTLSLAEGEPLAKRIPDSLPYSPFRACAVWLNEVGPERIEKEKTENKMEHEMDHMKSRGSTPESLHPFEDWYAIMKKNPGSHVSSPAGDSSASSIARDYRVEKESPDSPSNSSLASSRGSLAPPIAGDYYTEKQSLESPNNSSCAFFGGPSTSIAGGSRKEEQSLAIPNNSSAVPLTGAYSIERQSPGSLNNPSIASSRGGSTSSVARGCYIEQTLATPKNPFAAPYAGVYFTEKQSPDSPNNPSLASSRGSSPSLVARNLHTEGQPRDSPPSSPLAATHTKGPSKSPIQTPPVLSASFHQEQEPPAFEENSYLVSRQEHRKLCSELFARIANLEEMLENGEAGK